MINKKYDKKSLLLIVLIAYILILLRFTVFRTRSYPIDFSVNLSIFSDLVATYYENGLWMVLYLVLGNIVCFVPFGFLLPAIWDKLKWHTSVILGFGFSLLIETSQLVLKKGLFEIDDLILNTLGVAIGCLIQKFYRDFRE